jgi:peptide/nickel transport system permease protein
MIENQIQTGKVAGERGSALREAYARQSSWVTSWRRRPAFFWGTLLLSVIVVVAIMAPWIVPYDPIEQDLAQALQPPSMQHWFGTDNLGRDIFSRVLYGARLDLLIGVFGVLFAFILGTILGCFSGYFGGWTDSLIMRVVDTFIAFPFTVLMIAIIAMLGPGLRNMIITFTVAGWTAYARIIRGEILVVKLLEYILAARALGFSQWRILFRHVLPNVITPAVVFSMADIVLVILSAASLSFLGLGIPPPTPEWGQMIAEGRIFLLRAWWPVTLPGLVIVITAISFSLFGDGIADWLRPAR